MITIETTDERIVGFCNLWNAIPLADTSYENVTLLNGEVVDNIVILIRVPTLDLDNHSLYPEIHRGDQTITVTIPFYFPRDFKSKYDMAIILDAMTWMIVDTLSVYCTINAVHRYWLEQNLHQRNRYFLRSVDTGLNLDQTLRMLNAQILLSEMRLADSLKPIPLPSVDEATIEEELSHMTHKIRMTGYLFIASFESVFVSTEVLPFHFSKPIKTVARSGFTFIQLGAMYSIIDEFSKDSKFFSFIKHVSSSAKDLPYFPKGSLKDLNAKQLSSIVRKSKMPRDLNKNKTIETTFIQMVIINFYIAMKECLLQKEFTKIIREEEVPLEVHEKVHHSAAYILPCKVTQQLRETLDKCTNLNEFSLEEMLPADILMQNPDKVDAMSDSEQLELKRKFEGLSKKYGSKKTQDQVKVLNTAPEFLANILKQNNYLNTLMSHYSHHYFLKTTHEINQIKEHLEAVRDSKEETEEALELLLLNISDRQGEKIDKAHEEGEFDYSLIQDMVLNKADREKCNRIGKRISDFLEDLDEQLQPEWIIENYTSYLKDLNTGDAYIETLREQIYEIDELEKEIDIPLIDEETVHKLIYGLIGYYFNIHHTSELLQTVKKSKIPSLGDKNLPLKESFSMFFNQSFNSFTPKSIEFTDDEYKEFCSIIKSL